MLKTHCKHNFIFTPLFFFVQDRVPKGPGFVLFPLRFVKYLL